MAFPGFKMGKPGWEKQASTTKRGKLGDEMFIYPGRWFKYALAGEAATVNLLQAGIAAVNNHDLDLVVTAAGAAGATSISITLGATAATANEYQDGFVLFNDVEEEGHQYLIKSHLAVDSSGTGVFNLDEADGLATAITTSQQVGLVHNLCFDFVVYPTTPTTSPLGACCVDVANNAYSWLQYRGQGVARSDATTPAAGAPLAASDATAGNVELMDYSGTPDLAPVGYNMDAAGVSAESCAVLWSI
jgi:hypothetical protein